MKSLPPLDLEEGGEFTFQYPDGPFYNTFSWNPNEKSWTFRMEATGKDGKRTLFAQDSLRRP